MRRDEGRTCLSCNSALLRMSASASRVAIMQLLMAEASILTSRCGPLHTEGKWVGLPRGTRGKGGSLRLKACVVRLLCGLRSALRCGAVRWVNDSRLSRMHLTKIVWAGRKRATAGQRNQLQERSRGLPIRDSTVEAECLTWGSFLGLQVSALPCITMVHR